MLSKFKDGDKHFFFFYASDVPRLNGKKGSNFPLFRKDSEHTDGGKGGYGFSLQPQGPQATKSVLFTEGKNSIISKRTQKM